MREHIPYWNIAHGYHHHDSIQPTISATESSQRKAKLGIPTAQSQQRRNVEGFPRRESTKQKRFEGCICSRVLHFTIVSFRFAHETTKATISCRPVRSPLLDWPNTARSLHGFTSTRPDLNTSYLHYTFASTVIRRLHDVSNVCEFREYLKCRILPYRGNSSAVEQKKKSRHHKPRFVLTRGPTPRLCSTPLTSTSPLRTSWR